MTGTYSDGSTKTENVTAANITGFNSTVTATNQVLTITVGDKTVNYAVQIYPPVEFSSLARSISDKFEQDRQFSAYFTSTASGDTVTFNIRAGQEEANLAESFDVLNLMALLIQFESEYASTLDNITISPGSTFSRGDLVNNLTATYQDIQQAIASLAGAAGTPYADLKLKQLAGKTIQVKMVDGQIINLTLKRADECFIATAAFGSKFTWPVVLLRHFRDKYLMTNTAGTAFVNFYYRYSPPIAAFIAGSQPLKMLVRVLLAPVIAIVYLMYHPLLVGTVLVLLFAFFAYRFKLRRRYVRA